MAKAVRDTKAGGVVNFLVQEIFMYYRLLKQLLLDSGTNFLANMVEHYWRKLHTRNRYTIAYCSQINGKVKNLNGLLRDSWAKYLESKPKTLGEDYLRHALFAIRIKTHSTSKYSQYYLLYGQRFHLNFENNSVWPHEIVATTTSDHEKKIDNLQNTQLIANEALFERAIKAKKRQNKKTNK